MLLVFGGLLNPYFLRPPLALESWRGWRSARARPRPHPRWDPRAASPGPSAPGRGAPEAAWQPVNQGVSQMKTLLEALSRTPAPLRCPDFSISVHLSWKKLSKLFPITNFPGVLQGRPRCPACQLHPTWHGFLPVFTPGSRALGCICAHGSAGRGSCQPRSTLPAGDPGHLCWGDQPGGARSCVLRNHLEDSAKKRRRRLSPWGL